MDFGEDLKEDYLEKGYNWVWDIDGTQYGEIDRVYGRGELVGFQNSEQEEITSIEVNERANRAYLNILLDITETVPFKKRNLLENYGRIAAYHEEGSRAVGLLEEEADRLHREIGPLVNEALERRKEVRES